MLKYIVICLTLLSGTAKAEGLSNYTKQLILDVQVAAAVIAQEKTLMTPPTSKRGLRDVECLAVAVYHEARGEELIGQIGVASVLIQRARVPGRWGNTVCEVMVNVQFSFMTTENDFPPITEQQAWLTAVAVANLMIRRGPIPELAYGDHYHTVRVSPGWSNRITKIRQIGDHIFYADPKSIQRLKSRA